MNEPYTASPHDLADPIVFNVITSELTRQQAPTETSGIRLVLLLAQYGTLTHLNFVKWAR